MKGFDPKEFTEQATGFLRKILSREGFEKVVLGLSGGLDSAVVASLAVKALGPENVIVASLPYEKIAIKDKGNIGPDRDEVKMFEKLGIPIENLFFKPIDSIVDRIEFTLNLKGLEEYDGSKDLFPGDNYNQEKPKIDQREYEIRKGNVMARIRMIILFDLARANNALVLGTGNRTEYLMGYYTRYGDGASDIELIRSLYKTEVRQLARYLKVPETIISKPPSADLWPGQTDEGEIGASYEEIDKVLRQPLDRQPGRIAMTTRVPADTVREILAFREKNWFKHKVPYVFEP